MRRASRLTFVLVHSPLVGPGTWRPVAGELDRRGYAASVPSLLGAEGWRGCVEAVRAAVEPAGGPVVVAGHSGAGPLLPAMAGALSAPVARLVFVDAGLPAQSGSTPLAPPAFLDRLRDLAVDGMLPPWAEWWGDEEMRELVPDDALRAALARDMPSLPYAYFEQRVPAPPGWDRTPCAFVLLSDAYREPAAAARRRGWPVEEISGAQHLHIVVDPGAVAEALIRVAA